MASWNADEVITPELLTQLILLILYSLCTSQSGDTLSPRKILCRPHIKRRTSLKAFELVLKSLLFPWRHKALAVHAMLERLRKHACSAKQAAPFEKSLLPCWRDVSNLFSKRLGLEKLWSCDGCDGLIRRNELFDCGTRSIFVPLECSRWNIRRSKLFPEHVLETFLRKPASHRDLHMSHIFSPLKHTKLYRTIATDLP